jgi:glucans biosynthesis protein C
VKAAPAVEHAQSSLAIDNLRAIVILLVLAFHSALAYLSFLPHHPFAFDRPPFLWRAFPIVDEHRWIGFDLFCAWLDVFLMSLFFLLSGLFVWPSLTRKGVSAFLAGRIVRIGLPCTVIVLLVMPVALYPSYLESAATTPSLADFRQYLGALPLWPVGPMWFLWLLLIWDLTAAGLFQAMHRRRDAVPLASAYARRHPGRFLAGVATASALAYVPLALVCGTSPWFQIGPLTFQESRPLHYAVYFFAGVVIGACGIECGLAAPDGSLVRHWRGWLAAAVLTFAVWLSLTAMTRRQPGVVPLGLRTLDDLSFVLSCFSSCFFVLGLTLRCGRVRSPALASLTANGYGMYLIHYPFVVALQYELLATNLPGILKGAIGFGATLLLSWSATAALQQVPAVGRVIGTPRRGPAATLPAESHRNASPLVGAWFSRGSSPGLDRPA